MRDMIGMLSTEPRKLEKIRADFITSNLKQWERARNSSATAVQDLFPNAKRDIKPSLDLQEYVGRYYHKAYHYISLSEPTISNGYMKLKVDYGKRTWSLPSYMEHVSGEHWILHCGQASFDETWTSSSRSKFRIGSDGKVVKFGVVVDNTWEWFDRVE
jgi:hypothetical protein